MKFRWPRDLIEPRPATSRPAGSGAGGTLGRARAWASSHKLVLGAGAAGVVVLLALRNRAAAGAVTDPGTPAGTDPQGATIGGYDSSANDVYNALQPQIDQTQSLIRKLMGNIRRQRRENRRISRQLRRAQQRLRARQHRQRRRRGVQTPPTKPPVKTTRKLSTRLGTVSGTAQRRRAQPAPRAVPRAVVTRRASTISQVAAGAGSSFAQVAAANRGTVTPGQKLPAGTRIVVPTDRRR